MPLPRQKLVILINNRVQFENTKNSPKSANVHIDRQLNFLLVIIIAGSSQCIFSSLYTVLHAASYNLYCPQRWMRNHFFFVSKMNNSSPEISCSFFFFLTDLRPNYLHQFPQAHPIQCEH